MAAGHVLTTIESVSHCSKLYTGLVESEPESNDNDVLRRVLIERRGPRTWKGIWGCAGASVVGLVLVLIKPGEFWELFGAAVFLVGAFEVLNGMFHKTCFRSKSQQ